MNRLVETEVNAIVAQLAFMVNGQMGRDWRSGREFVLHTKGDEVEAVRNALRVIWHQRTELAAQAARIEEAEKVCDSYAAENQRLHDRAETAEARIEELTRECELSMETIATERKRADAGEVRAAALEEQVGVLTSAAQSALVAMSLAAALPGVSNEYDFGPAIQIIRAALNHGEKK